MTASRSPESDARLADAQVRRFHCPRDIAGLESFECRRPALWPSSIAAAVFPREACSLCEVTAGDLQSAERETTIQSIACNQLGQGLIESLQERRSGLDASASRRDDRWRRSPVEIAEPARKLDPLNNRAMESQTMRRKPASATSATATASPIPVRVATRRLALAMAGKRQPTSAPAPPPARVCARFHVRPRASSFALHAARYARSSAPSFAAISRSPIQSLGLRPVVGSHA